MVSIKREISILVLNALSYVFSKLLKLSIEAKHKHKIETILVFFTQTEVTGYCCSFLKTQRALPHALCNVPCSSKPIQYQPSLLVPFEFSLNVFIEFDEFSDNFYFQKVKRLLPSNLPSHV